MTGAHIPDLVKTAAWDAGCQQALEKLAEPEIVRVKTTYQPKPKARSMTPQEIAKRVSRSKRKPKTSVRFKPGPAATGWKALSGKTKAVIITGGLLASAAALERATRPT